MFHVTLTSGLERLVGLVGSVTLRCTQRYAQIGDNRHPIATEIRDNCPTMANAPAAEATEAFEQDVIRLRR